ncbi:MAG: hypothetical protein R3F61_24640 [Myxococcota bacterium]
MRDAFLALSRGSTDAPARAIWADWVEERGEPGWGAVLGGGVPEPARGIGVAIPNAGHGAVRALPFPDRTASGPGHLWWRVHDPRGAARLLPWLALDPVVHLAGGDPLQIPSALAELARVAPWLTSLDVQHPVAPVDVAAFRELRSLAVHARRSRAQDSLPGVHHLRVHCHGVPIGGWADAHLPALTRLELVLSHPLRVWADVRDPVDMLLERLPSVRVLDVTAPGFPPHLDVQRLEPLDTLLLRGPVPPALLAVLRRIATVEEPREERDHAVVVL